MIMLNWRAHAQTRVYICIDSTIQDGAHLCQSTLQKISLHKEVIGIYETIL